MKKLFKHKANVDSLNSENPKLKKNHKSVIIRIVFIIVILSCIFAFYVINNDSRYKGEVEAVIVPNIAEISGKIIESDISLGQSVKKGDVLAKIDSTDLNYTLTQLQFNLQKRNLALGEVTVGQGGQATNAYLSAQANYNSASIAASKASNDYNDAKVLYAEGGISSSDLEKARISLSSAASLASAALGQLNNALSETGQSSAQIDISILEDQINQAKDNLAKYTLIAPCDGTIISKNYGVGSIVAPGYNISDIGSMEEMYVVLYIPESKISDVQYDSLLKVTYNGEAISCKVKYIDSKSQYTPRELQTKSNKDKTNFKVKLLVPQSSNLKPGMEVNVTIK
jgi:multidrug resistance efflux pump